MKHTTYRLKMVNIVISVIVLNQRIVTQKNLVIYQNTIELFKVVQHSAVNLITISMMFQCSLTPPEIR